MTRITAEDIAAVRAEEGDLRQFIATLVANQPTATAPPPPPRVGALHGPAHRPGAWPAGTRTDRDTCQPDCTCTLAPPATHATTTRPA